MGNSLAEGQRNKLLLSAGSNLGHRTYRRKHEEDGRQGSHYQASGPPQHHQPPRRQVSPSKHLYRGRGIPAEEPARGVQEGLSDQLQLKVQTSRGAQQPSKQK